MFYSFFYFYQTRTEASGRRVRGGIAVILLHIIACLHFFEIVFRFPEIDNSLSNPDFSLFF